VVEPALKSRRFKSIADLERANFDLTRIQEWAGLNFQAKMARVLDRAAARVEHLLSGMERDRRGRFKITALNQAMAANIASDLSRVLKDAGYDRVVEEHLAVYSALYDQAKKIYEGTGVPFAFDQQDVDHLQMIADADATYFGRLPQLGVAAVEKALMESVLVGADFQVAANAIEAALGAEGSPLARYAFTYANDSLLNFSAATSAVRDRKYKPEAYYYAGTLIKTSRRFCIGRAGKVWQRKEVLSWSKLDWQGKKPGPILIVRGGWNCKHSLVAVTNTWAAVNGLDIETGPAPIPPAPKRKKPPGLKGASYLPGGPKGAKLFTWRGPVAGGPLPGVVIRPPGGLIEKPKPKPAAPPPTRRKVTRPKKDKPKSERFEWKSLDDDRLPIYNGAKKFNDPVQQWVKTPAGFKLSWCSSSYIRPLKNDPEYRFQLGETQPRKKVAEMRPVMAMIKEGLAKIKGSREFQRFVDNYEVVLLDRATRRQTVAGFTYADQPERSYVCGDNNAYMATVRRNEVRRIAEMLYSDGRINRERAEAIARGTKRFNMEANVAGTIAHEFGHGWQAKKLGNWNRMNWDEIKSLDGEAWKEYLKISKKRMDTRWRSFRRQFQEVVADDMRLIILGEDFARNVRPNYRCMESDIIDPDRAELARGLLMKALGLERKAPARAAPAAAEPGTAGVKLTPAQKEAISFAAKKGKITEKEYKKLAGIYGWTAADLKTLSERIVNETKLCINRTLHPQSNSFKDLLENGRMKNQFELSATGVGATSGGHLSPNKGGSRDRWEKTFTGGAFHKSPAYKKIRSNATLSVELAKERPVYGYLNDPRRYHLGGAYGRVTFVLKQEVKKRTTFTRGNSSGIQPADIDEGAVMTIDNHKAILTRLLFENTREDLQEMINGHKPLEGYGHGVSYIEAQVHGGVEIGRDVEKIVVKVSEYRNRSYYKHIEELGKKYGIEVEFRS